MPWAVSTSLKTGFLEVQESRRCTMLLRWWKGKASVLATGRIASHFVGVERLDTVGQAPLRWDAFEEEAGPGRSGIELFDWIVVDTYEQFQQSAEDTQFILDEAERAGYGLVDSRRGVMVFRRADE